MSDSILKQIDSTTRMIAMGTASLMEGFALLGFETWPDAQKEDVEKVLTDIQQKRHKALILLESYLTEYNLPVVQRFRKSGGDIIITEIPAFHNPEKYHLLIDKLIVQALGPNAIND